jgi:hypothetical protein
LFSRSARLLVSDSLLGDFLLRFLLLGSVVKTQLIYFTARQGSRPRIPTPSSFLSSVGLVSFEIRFFLCARTCGSTVQLDFNFHAQSSVSVD